MVRDKQDNLSEVGKRILMDKARDGSQLGLSVTPRDLIKLGGGAVVAIGFSLFLAAMMLPKE